LVESEPLQPTVVFLKKTVPGAILATPHEWENRAKKSFQKGSSWLLQPVIEP
jgi:hypothetical protein